MSASRIISSTSSSVSFSPRLVMTWRSSAAEMKPLPSLSNTRNASRISSSESVSFILRAIIVRNSGKSIVPLPAVVPSASTSLIMSCSSASVGFWPSERMTVPSSLVVMVPSPSLSNSENASLNSARTAAETFASNTRHAQSVQSLDTSGIRPKHPFPYNDGHTKMKIYRPHATLVSSVSLRRATPPTKF
ncbi:unnamed protein product [Ixodes pacificus]